MSLSKIYNTTIFVLGEGPIPCRVMLIGEAPGADEENYRKPFVGMSGRLLNRLLVKHAKLSRSQVYITNAVKQRPPENRKPTFEEISKHREYLLAEISIVAPKLIITLGKTALESVLGREIIALNSYINRKLFYLQNSIELCATYHPAALIYNREYLPEFIKTMERIKDANKN